MLPDLPQGSITEVLQLLSAQQQNRTDHMQPQVLEPVLSHSGYKNNHPRIVH